MKLTLTQKSLRYLKHFVKDHRVRELQTRNGEIFLSGELIWRFDDATACHHFLIWLDAQRKAEKDLAKDLAARKKHKMSLAWDRKKTLPGVAS